MRETELRSRPAAPRSPVEPRPGDRASRWSFVCLGWLLVAPIVGFALAGRVFDLGAQGPWEPWKAVVLGAVLMTPFVVGASLGVSAVRHGSRSGWLGLVGNLVFAAFAIGMPIVEALS